MLSIDDVAEILGREILGVVPDDEEVIDTTNRGQPVALDASRHLAAIYTTMARRLLGEDVPALEVQADGLWMKLRRIMVGQR